MRRRELLAMMAGVVAAWPLSVHAQQSAMPAVGWLNPQPLSSSRQLLDGFRKGLGEAGFVDGKNVMMELRPADGKRARLPALADDLVRRGVLGDHGRVSTRGTRRQARDPNHSGRVHIRHGPRENRPRLELQSTGWKRHGIPYPVHPASGKAIGATA